MSEVRPAAQPAIHRAMFADLSAAALYELLRLRTEVFVVEQKCAYPELDGRDLEPGTEHVWTSDEAGPTAYLRVLTDVISTDASSDQASTARIGRVCTRADARGAGLAAVLLRGVLDRTGDRPVVLEAQEYLAGWYARFGFVPTGPSYVEDGIAHLPMRLTPGS